MKTAVYVGAMLGILGPFTLLNAADAPESSAEKSQAQQTTAIPVSAQELMMNGKVEKVDKSKNEVKLKGADGNNISLHINPEKVSLDNIKKGDQVQVKYLESVALSVSKGSESANAPAPSSK